MINIEMYVRLEENNLGLYVRGSHEMLLKDAKKVGIVKTENLMEKKTSRKIAKMSLKTHGRKRECMDSLFVKCLRK